MSSTIPTKPHRKALIGSSTNFWSHSTETGFDLTHPSTHSTPIPGPKLTVQTPTTPITVDPSKSALVMIDLQNFFLSSALGRNQGAGHAACEQLVQYAIPAARKAGIRVVWLNWGLTENDVKEMPPAVRRAFGFFSVPTEASFNDGEHAFAEHESSMTVDKFGKELGKEKGMYRGLGAECGTVEIEDGKTVEVGRLLMRDTWNAALYPPLDAIYEEGAKLDQKPDVWIHKDRMSGMWGAKTECEEFLEREGIRTLFFAGVNTDQCVGGTLTDAFSKGYDCVLLSDGCGTTSPAAAQQCYVYNSARTYGFCTTCEELWKGAERLVE
jgi:nicotinamidase-related amidase